MIDLKPRPVFQIIPVLLIILFVFSNGISFSQSNPLHEEQIPTLHASPAKPDTYTQPDTYTLKSVTGYVSYLLAGITDTPDPFFPDEDAIKTLSSIMEALRSKKPVVVYNGEVYENITAGGIANEGGAKTYYFKPSKSKVPNSEYLKIISSEKIDPSEFYNAVNDPVQRDIRKLFLEHLLAYMKTHPQLKSTDLKNLQEIITPEFTGRVKSYLDKRLKDKILSGFNYEPANDSLTLTYGSEEIPFQLHPLMDAKTVDFVIRTHLHAKQYAKKALKDYRQRISSGEVLIINTKKKEPFHDFFERDALLEEFLILSDEGLTKGDKIEKFSSGLKRVQPGGKLEKRQKRRGGKSRKSASTGTAPSAGSVSELLDSRGVIVPPTRRIAFLRAPDYIVRQYIEGDIFKEESYEIKQLRNPAGILSIYHQNDYTIEITTAGWEEFFVETLAGIMSDESISIVYLKTHGDIDALLAEIYDIGAVDFTRDDETYRQSRKNLSALRRRVQSLRGKYGSGSISVYLKMRSVLSERDRTQLNKHVARIPEQLRHLLKEQRRLGVIAVTGEFFQKIPGKKALFILRACHGGSLADKIKARDILACDPRCFTSEYMFVQSDLQKIAPYIFKKIQPGPLKLTKENMRTYDIITSFKNPPVLRPGVDIRIEQGIIDRYYPQKDRLLSIKLWGPQDQAVSPSPHVESADGDRIIFNAPMDNSVPAGDVVTVTCRAHPEEAANLKPKWISDREIALPWKGKLYTDWKDSDFYANGNPKVDYDIIVVKHGAAKSKFSHVQLSGNPDGVTRKYCRIKECWRDPCLIKYNGNRPKTDFVFMLPCIKKEKPEPGPGRIITGECVQHFLYPDKNNHYNDLLLDGNTVIDAKESYEKYRKIKMADPSKKASHFSFGKHQCLAAFKSHTAYVRETMRDERLYELFHDGSVVYKGKEKVKALQLFGDHIMYWLGRKKLVYDGTTFDAGNVRQSIMSTTSMLSLSKKGELKLNGKTVGMARRGSTITGMKTILSSNKSYERYPYGCLHRDNGNRAYCFKDVYLFRDNVAFFDTNDHARLYLGKSGQQLDFGQAFDMFLFGNHVVVVKMNEYTDKSGSHGYLSIEYDGRDMGPGEYPIIFGDHLAFATSSNPVTRKGLNFERSAEYLFRKENEPFFPDYKRFVFLDGKYYDVAETLKLSPAYDYSITSLRFFDGRLAFHLHIRDVTGGGQKIHMIYDWKDMGEVKEEYFRVNNHEVYIEKSSGKDHVVYDGKDLGPGSHPVIFGNHIAYETVSSEKGRQLVFDGKEYPINSSMYANLRACYKYYLENKVPTSPFGTVDFAEKKEEKER